MNNRADNFNSLSFVYLKLSFVPITVVVIIVLVATTIKEIRDAHSELSEEAQIIADMVTVIAAQNPLPVELMSKQVDILLKDSKTLKSVNFYPLTQKLPKQNAKNTGLFEQIVTKNTAVMLEKDADGKGVLIGYINVTMKSKEVREQIFISASIKCLLAFLVLLVLYFFVLYMFRARINSIKQLEVMSRKVLTGNYDVTILEHERSQSRELRLFEEALENLSAKIRLYLKNQKQLKKSNEELVMRDQALMFKQNTFQSMITHELRTPLNAISGGLQLLETKRFDPSDMDSLGIVRRGYNKLSTLLDNIIELNNLQQDKVVIENERFNPEKLLRDLAQDYSQTCLQKGITLAVDVKHNEKALFGDVEKIKSILDHLLNNAVKFTSSGTITLRSHVRKYLDSHEVRWQCDIEDTGIGIPKDILPDIFDAYVQADSSGSREFEGSGLGLTLAKKTTELLQGELSAISQEGKGSNFILRLTLDDGMQKHHLISLEDITVMYLHHDGDSTLKHNLEAYGAKVREYDDLQIGIEVFKEKAFDVVLVSKTIPPTVARRFAELARRQEENSRCIICYSVSTKSDDYDMETMVKAGIDFVEAFDSFDGLANSMRQWLML